jgi:hypothetical protein
LPIGRDRNRSVSLPSYNSRSGRGIAVPYSDPLSGKNIPALAKPEDCHAQLRAWIGELFDRVRNNTPKAEK